jgi:hypothetical protein
MTNYLGLVPRDVADELHALDRCLESQRLLIKQIDEANPDDPYASMMVDEDVCLVERLKDRVIEAARL